MHTVADGEFEGPFAILLNLVERRQLEVTSIPVAAITAGYLEHIDSLSTRSPEDLSEFLAFGARLLYIKSLALLPATESGQQTEELHALNLELEEYKRLQTVARALAANTNNRTWPRPSTVRLQPHDLPLPEFSLEALAAALARALAIAPTTKAPSTIRVTLSQQVVMGRLRQRLATGFELNNLLRDCANRLEVIVTFLALLELIREGTARVGQTSQFGAIEVQSV